MSYKKVELSRSICIEHIELVFQTFLTERNQPYITSHLLCTFNSNSYLTKWLYSKMWTGYRKTIFTTIIVVLVAFSFHFFKNENQLHGVLLKFEEYVDELWKRDLYDTIKARSYYTGWSVK